jgi:hypothetical protein
MSDRKKTGVWLWIAPLLIGLPILYVASFGPACWAVSRIDQFDRELPIIYQPIGWLCFGYDAPPLLEECMAKYARLGMESSEVVDVPIGNNEVSTVPGKDWDLTAGGFLIPR